MRPAIEVATQICGCADARQRKSDIALIEADRAELVAEIVADFRNLAGERRIVVECTVEEVAGALHIYNPEQLEVVENV